MAYPKEVTAADFSAALHAFEQLLGKEWVFTSDEDVALYRDAYSPFWGEPEERLASAAIAPSTVEQVQQIVLIANTYKIPLYPISTGKNLGYGGSAPAYSGSVVLDLKRMNRVLEINDKQAYALVEPGVSFFDLYRAIQAKGLKLWAGLPAPGWGSPIGNALDHGFGPLVRDHFGNHAGMEVVLGNGEIIRTGMGALPNSAQWQTYKYGFGPYIDGLFQQSNFGIVTKMGFNLVPEPEAVRRLNIAVWRYDDLDAFIDAASYIENIGVSRYGVNIGSPLMSAMDPDTVAMFTRPNGVAASEWDARAKQKNVPMFSTTVAFHGPVKIVDAQVEYAKELFSRIPGVTFSDGKAYRFPLDYDTVAEGDKQIFGIPSLSTFTMLPRSGHSGHFYFSPNLPMTGDALRKANQVFQQTCQKAGAYWGWAWAANCFPKTLTILKDFNAGQGVSQNKFNRELALRLIEVGAEHGWSEYRTPAAFHDAVMKSFSFNNHSLLRFHEAVKDAIDPNGILAAGRGGIWPKHLRGKKA